MNVLVFARNINVFSFARNMNVLVFARNMNVLAFARNMNVLVYFVFLFLLENVNECVLYMLNVRCIYMYIYKPVEVKLFNMCMMSE